MNSIFFLGGQFAPDGGGQFESDCIGLTRPENTLHVFNNSPVFSLRKLRIS